MSSGFEDFSPAHPYPRGNKYSQQLFMHIPAQRFLLTIVISVVLSGCATPERPALHTVENQTPTKPFGLYEINEVDTKPQLHLPKAPHYPSELKKAGIDGEALLLFTVKADGTVADVMILKATDARFGEAARESMLKWEFKPALLKGRAVACRITQKLVFTAVDE
jgi:TonB family protein